MEITITNDTNYLRDAEFWSYVIKRAKAAGNAIVPTDGADNVDIVSEMGNMIDSIEVFADSTRLFYIKDARYLISILNQRKVRPCEEQLFFKTEDMEELKWVVNVGPGAAGANIISANADLAEATEMDMKRIAALRKWRCAKKSFRV